MTVARLWRGITLATKANQYLEYLNEFVAPAFQMAEGNEGLLVLQDQQDELAYFWFLSFWTSHEALRNFTGANSLEFDIVHLSPEEQSLLVAFESTARYYKVVYNSALSPNKNKL